MLIYIYSLHLMILNLKKKKLRGATLSALLPRWKKINYVSIVQ